MKLIDKNNFEIVERRRASSCSHFDFAILSNAIITENFPLKYRTGIEKDLANCYSHDQKKIIAITEIKEGELCYDICEKILEMTQTEKNIYDAEIADRARRATFKDFSIKIEVMFDFAYTNLNAYMSQCVSDPTILVEGYEKSIGDKGEVEKTCTIYFRRMKYSDYDQIKNLITGGFLKVSTIDDDAIDIVIDNKYKYLVPNIPIQ